MKKVTPPTPLTVKEAERLRICTETVLEGLQKCFDAGIALIEVRDHKLYRETFSTFKEFCEEVFKISKQRAYQLIEATVIKESLPAKVAKHIVNESQARALADVPEEDRAKVVIEAAKTGTVTAVSINEAASQKSTTVDSSQPVKTGNANIVPVILRDKLDREIPSVIVEDWRRAEETGNTLRALASKIKTTVEKALADRDVVFAEITNPTVADAAALHYTLSQIVPYAVCPGCGGRGRNACQLCRKRGFISKYLYQSPAVSSDLKKILERGK